MPEVTSNAKKGKERYFSPSYFFVKEEATPADFDRNVAIAAATTLYKRHASIISEPQRFYVSLTDEFSYLEAV